jgi:hypothetical protein
MQISKDQKARFGRLFRCLLLLLREGEPLGLFPACLAFLNVISALAVSHKEQHSPTCRSVAMERLGGSDMAGKAAKGSGRAGREQPRYNS